MTSPRKQHGHESQSPLLHPPLSLVRWVRISSKQVEEVEEEVEEGEEEVEEEMEEVFRFEVFPQDLKEQSHEGTVPH